jgi:hypothetical protein
MTFREYLDEYLKIVEPETVFNVTDERSIDDYNCVFTVLNTRNNITMDITIKHYRYTHNDLHEVINIKPKGYLDLGDDNSLDNVFRESIIFVEDYVGTDRSIGCPIIDSYDYVEGTFLIDMYDNVMEDDRRLKFNIIYDPVNYNITDIKLVCEIVE